MLLRACSNVGAFAFSIRRERGAERFRVPARRYVARALAEMGSPSRVISSAISLSRYPARRRRSMCSAHSATIARLLMRRGRSVSSWVANRSMNVCASVFIVPTGYVGQLSENCGEQSYLAYLFRFPPRVPCCFRRLSSDTTLEGKLGVVNRSSPCFTNNCTRSARSSLRSPSQYLLSVV